MNIRQYVHQYVPYLLIAICLIQIVSTWSNQSEAFAWVVAATGWMLYKFDA